MCILYSVLPLGTPKILCASVYLYDFRGFGLPNNKLMLTGKQSGTLVKYMATHVYRLILYVINLLKRSSGAEKIALHTIYHYTARDETDIIYFACTLTVMTF